MALGRIVSVILRASQLIFATIVAAVTGMYLARSQESTLYLSRFIYAEVVSGLSICLCVLWIVPHSGTFTHWPFDILLSLLWWAVFGLLVHVCCFIPKFPSFFLFFVLCREFLC